MAVNALNPFPGERPCETHFMRVGAHPGSVVALYVGITLGAREVLEANERY
jgi:hypothetical protein